MKILKTESWDTGRLYNKSGQHITAWLIELSAYDAVIYFNDSSRMIDGLIPVQNTFPLENAGLQRFTMAAYDHSQHSPYLRTSDHYSNQYDRHEVYCCDVRNFLKSEGELK